MHTHRNKQTQTQTSKWPPVLRMWFVKWLYTQYVCFRITYRRRSRMRFGAPFRSGREKPMLPATTDMLQCYFLTPQSMTRASAAAPVAMDLVLVTTAKTPEARHVLALINHSRLFQTTAVQCWARIVLATDLSMRRKLGWCVVSAAVARWRRVPVRRQGRLGAWPGGAAVSVWLRTDRGVAATATTWWSPSSQT